MLIKLLIIDVVQPSFDYTQNRESTVGKELLKFRGMFTEGHWYWICVLALFGFSLIFNLCFVLALTFLTRMSTVLINLLEY